MGQQPRPGTGIDQPTAGLLRHFKGFHKAHAKVLGLLRQRGFVFAPFRVKGGLYLDPPAAGLSEALFVQLV